MQGGHVPQELVDVEGRDWVVGALWWWGHFRDASLVTVAFVGAEGVECAGDDVLCLSFQGYVPQPAEILGYVGCRVDGDVGYGWLMWFSPPRQRCGIVCYLGCVGRGVSGGGGRGRGIVAP